jgi:hypothetical protein
MKHTKEDVISATELLKKTLANNPTLYFVYMGGSRSGMQRRYVVLANTGRGVVRVSWAIAATTTIALHRDEQSLKMNGCGYSAVQEIAERVSRVIGAPVEYREF